MSFDIGTLRGHFCFFLELFQKLFFSKNYHLWVSRESARRTWLMSTYIDHPHQSKKKSWQKKLAKKQKKKVHIWALSFCINHLHICITIADSDITESGVLIWFSWVLKSTISPLKKCKIWTLTGCADQPEHALKVRYDFSEAHCIRDHIIRRDLSKVKTFFLTHPTYRSGLCSFLEISFSPKRGPETI